MTASTTRHFFWTANFFSSWLVFLSSTKIKGICVMNPRWVKPSVFQAQKTGINSLDTQIHQNCCSFHGSPVFLINPHFLVLWKVVIWCHYQKFEGYSLLAQEPNQQGGRNHLYRNCNSRDHSVCNLRVNLVINKPTNQVGVGRCCCLATKLVGVMFGGVVTALAL